MVSLIPNSACACIAFIFTPVFPLLPVFKDCLPLADPSSSHYLPKNVHVCPHNCADTVFCPTITSYSVITCLLRNEIKLKKLIKLMIPRQYLLQILHREFRKLGSPSFRNQGTVLPSTLPFLQNWSENAGLNLWTSYSRTSEYWQLCLRFWKGQETLVICVQFL